MKKSCKNNVSENTMFLSLFLVSCLNFNHATIWNSKIDHVTIYKT